MKRKRLRSILQASTYGEVTTPTMCPPHDFEGAWAELDGEDTHHGVIFCKRCGEVRGLGVPQRTTVDIYGGGGNSG
jgi:hypothetical protein